MQRVITTAFFLIACAIGAAAVAQDDVRKLATEPRRTGDGDGSSARLDFSFGNVRAWLLQDGNWRIQGDIQHRSIFCGQYELGIQFGIGNPGCSNVEWIGSPAYVTNRTHCNNAMRFHSGGDINYAAAEAFDRINCAQRLIRCSGNCR